MNRSQGCHSFVSHLFLGSYETTKSKWIFEGRSPILSNTETWLPQHPTVVTNLLKIWVSESFQDRHRKVVSAKLWLMEFGGVIYPLYQLKNKHALKCYVLPFQDNLDYLQWQEPRLLLECLLNYFKHHPNEIELLFHMLRCFTSRYIPQFQFFKDFLEETIAEVYIRIS